MAVDTVIIPADTEKENSNQAMPNVTILEAEMKEQPYFYEFKKSEIVRPHPTMANLTYDPYPGANMEDVVRKEIIGRELILRAKVKLENPSFDAMRPGIALDFQGHKFTVIESNFDFETNIVEVIGSKFLTPIEPMEHLKRLRQTLAASNP
ncbi:MAG: hypothetical protein ABSH15_03780 [Verrucomicrobiota bacterium]